MPFLIQTVVRILTNAMFDRAVVLALWAKAQASPGKLDDVLVQAVAAALGVTLPNAPTAPKTPSAEAPERVVHLVEQGPSGDGAAPAPGEHVA